MQSQLVKSLTDDSSEKTSDGKLLLDFSSEFESFLSGRRAAAEKKLEVVASFLKNGVRATQKCHRPAQLKNVTHRQLR